MDMKRETRCLPPEDMLCFDIYALHQAFGRIYAPVLQPLGLTYPQYLVLSCLWDIEPLSVGRIGARLGLETSTLTPLLKRLEARGLVERRRSTVDERRKDIRLTKAGRALGVEARGIPACIEAKTGFGPGEIAELRATLARLRAALARD